MLSRKFATINLIFGTVLTVMITTDMIKDKIKKLAETEEVGSAREYVLVRLARGDYSNRRGFETIQYDYKFFDLISKFDE